MENRYEKDENDNEFCSKDANKQNNKKEVKEQINKISDKNKNISFIKTNSYVPLHGKFTISLSKEEKKELANKYWIIRPERKFDFYGKEIKNIYSNENVSGLKDLVGILMVFKRFLAPSDYKKFDNYFSIRIKSHERNYVKPSKKSEIKIDSKDEEEKLGKILFIGGNLKVNIGNMFKQEFENCNNKDLPIYCSIMVYREYEEIEIEALDHCNKIPDHDGFLQYNKVFHQDFPKKLSNKIKRIKEDRNKKREELLKEE
jgi:hypothetical protein